MMKRQLPLLIVFAGGVVMILEYFLRIEALSETRELFTKWARIGFTCAVLVGIANLAMVNLQKVLKKQRGWIYNAVLLVAMLVTMLPGIVVGWQKGVCHWMFETVYTPLSATMFGLLAFFIASAAFRAFRMRNIEAFLLLASAILVMLGNIPMFQGQLGAFFAEIQTVIMEGPMTGAQRAILMAAATGAIFFALKLLFGIDRSYFGGGE